MVCKVYGHRIAYHLVSVAHIGVYEAEVIGEPLYACDFPDCHSSIKMLFPRHEPLAVLVDPFHPGRLRMKLALPSGSLHRECGLVPLADPVPGHENGRVPPYVEFVVRDRAPAAVRPVFRQCGDCAVLEIVYAVPERRLGRQRRGSFEVQYLQVFPEPDVEYTFAVFRHAEGVRVEQFQVHILYRIVEKLQDVAHGGGVPRRKQPLHVFGHEEFELDRLQDADVLVKQSPPRILYALLRARLAPGLAWRPADDSRHVLGKAFRRYVPDVALEQFHIGEIRPERWAYSGIALVRNDRAESRLAEAHVESAGAAE